jgi:hypothetical protein
MSKSVWEHKADCGVSRTLAVDDRQLECAAWGQTAPGAAGIRGVHCSVHIRTSLLEHFPLLAYI